MVDWLQSLLMHYGYLAVFFGVLVESMGVPLPGETLLLLGAAYAGTGRLHVWGVILAAALGAIIGDSLGYELGRTGGRALLDRYGRVLHLNPKHLERTEGFFQRYGDSTVLFGRFIAILRTFSAFLAGMNHMPYPRFLLFNALGGMLWAITFGLLGAAFGSQWQLIEHWVGRAGLLIGGILVIVVLAVLGARWIIRHETELRARWTAFLMRPRVAAFRTRFAPQLAFLQARLSPQGVLGLQLTIGLVILGTAGWLFGGITEDVVHNDPLVQIDQAVSQWLHAHTEPPFTRAMAIVSLAGGQLVAIASIGLAAFFIWRHRWTELWLFLIGVGGGQLLNLLLKALVGRHRPVWSSPLLLLTDPAFPSGHAMASTLFYGLLAYLIARRSHSWRIGVTATTTAVILILLIGFSRIYLGVHFLSDVLGGYAAGVVWLTLTITSVTIMQRYQQAQETAPPRPTPTGQST